MRFFRRQPEPEVIVDLGYPAADAKRVGDAPYDRATCPYCDTALDPLPKAKKKCAACGQPIYVRSGPSGMRYLLREADLDAHQARWDAYYDAREDADAAKHNREAARSSAESIAWMQAGQIIWVSDLPLRRCLPGMRRHPARVSDRRSADHPGARL